MKFNELTKMSWDDLKQKKSEFLAELFQLKLKLKTRQLENKSKVRELRHDMARVQTRMTELAREQAKKAGASS